MLNILRKKGIAKKIIWIIAIIIIISFGFFGTAYLLNGNLNQDDAGRIFGKNVSLEAFKQVYHHTDIQAMLNYGKNYQSFKQFLNLENQTWDRLILLYEAKRRHIQIPDDRVVKTIESFPFFQRDGQFDTLLYNDILRFAFKITARNFEEGIRDNLKIQEIINQETASLSLSEEEILEEFKRINEKTQISYVFIAPDQFKSQVTANADELQQYYGEHDHEFLVPPTVAIDYISLNFPEAPPEVTPAPAESEVPQQKTQPPSETQQNEKKIDEIRKKAQAVFEELLSNPNIHEVAQKNGLEVKNTGFFSMEQPVLTLGWSYETIDKIFQLNVNQVSGPFETTAGLFIPQIKEKREAYVPTYAEVQDKVNQAVLQMKAREIAGLKAKEYLASIQQTFNTSGLDNFSEIAKTLGLDIHQTPVFARGQYLPQIGISNEFQEAAFRLSEQEKISGVVEIPQGYCILHWDSAIPAEQEKFEAEKAKLANDLLQEKKNKAFGDFLDKLRLKAGLVNKIPSPKDRGL